MKSFLRLALLLTACFACPTFSPAQSGVYLELHRRDEMPPPHVNHPLVDGVIIGWPWAELEPRKGQFNFAIIDRAIAPWIRAGKKVMINVDPAGQGEKPFTPDWVLKSVPVVEFDRKNKDFEVAIPKYWDPAFLPTMKPLVQALGKKYGRDAHIEAVMVGVAHLGFLTAAPNEGGGKAFLDAGWTPQKWKDYAFSVIELYKTEFPGKPLFVRGSSMVVRAPNPGKMGFPRSTQHFNDVRDDILLAAATKYGVGVACNGLEADVAKLEKSGLADLYKKLAPLAASGKISLELSDDWPIWVNAKRRETSVIDKGKDNQYYAAALENSIGGVRGLPKTNVTWIKLFETDLDCCDPKSRDYQPECAEKLKWYKSQLIKPPAKPFGS